MPAPPLGEDMPAPLPDEPRAPPTSPVAPPRELLSPDEPPPGLGIPGAPPELPVVPPPDEPPELGIPPPETPPDDGEPPPLGDDAPEFSLHATLTANTASRSTRSHAGIEAVVWIVFMVWKPY